MLREAISQCERIYTEHPDLPLNRIALSQALSHLASLLLDGGRSEEGMACHRRALDAVRSAPSARPDSTEVRTQLAVRLYELAKAEHEHQRHADQA